MRIKECLFLHCIILLFSLNLVSFGMENDRAPIVISPYIMDTYIMETDKPLILSPNSDSVTPSKAFRISPHPSNRESKIVRQVNFQKLSPKNKKFGISTSAPIIPDAKTMLNRLTRRYSQ